MDICTTDTYLKLVVSRRYNLNTFKPILIYECTDKNFLKNTDKGISVHYFNLHVLEGEYIVLPSEKDNAKFVVYGSR